MPSVLTQTTTPYRASEAWIFDTVIAPAISDLRDQALGDRLKDLPLGARVLEVGAGGGQLAVDLAARRPDLRIVGLDLSPEQVARARRRTEHVRDRVDFVQGSALDLPFAAGELDAVISIGSIKHWPDPARGVAECVRVLRPGGLLTIVEVDRGCRLEEARSFVGKWRMPGAFRPLGLLLFRTFVAGQAIDLDEARALLAAHPLTGVTVERIAGAPALILQGRVVGAS
jgi:SAM-dependent methyltransferase